jgi:hypothetical protein
LQGKRQSPSPLVGPIVGAIGGGGNDNITDRLTHLEHSRNHGTNGDRDYAGVGGGVSSEDSLGDTFKRLSDDKYSE